MLYEIHALNFISGFTKLHIIYVFDGPSEKYVDPQ